MRILMVLAGLGIAASSGAAPTPPTKSTEPAPDAKALVQNCDAHKFETTIRLMVRGQAKQSKVRLCGNEGQSDADWIVTLKDAVAKTATNDAMAQPVRDQIIAAVNAEIARLSAPQGLMSGTDISRLRVAPPKAEVPLSRDYGSLPPLPIASSVPPPSLLTPDGSKAPAPRLTLRCAEPGDADRPSACDSLGANTLLVVRADEAFPAGLEMRFIRRGDPRAELDLPAMRAGQTTTIQLPPAVCAGVARSSVEIQAVAAKAASGTSAATVAEYELRC